MTSIRTHAPTPQSLFADWSAYVVDAAQRTILTLDTMRRRGNQYLDTIERKKPPVLIYDYELIVDGRTLERPVNYMLSRIIPPADVVIDEGSRPVIVVDPRAGQVAGIGGFKSASEIGFALKSRHPVYFVHFLAEPVPGQTLDDIRLAEARFVKVVARRHPNPFGKPVVYANCQAGWQTAVMAGTEPDNVGLLCLNGAPMSYWAGKGNQNSMRYIGGMLGGAWLSRLAGDLGNGRFDGASIVQNFDALNLANTYWSKMHNLYAKIDTEDSRFLDFERWWGAFSLMNAEEMTQIAEDFFVGDKLERGLLEIGGETVNLKKIKAPILCFASWGDNITPPQQALNWIPTLYPTTRDIRANGQTIVYLVHESVGHLGIFVGSQVAKKDHAEMIEMIEYIDLLPPGLYEMVIDEAPADPQAAGARYLVHFESRETSDIAKLNDPTEFEAFAALNAVSEWNGQAYDILMAPWVRAFTNEASARFIRQTNPLRLEYAGLSNLNPFLAPIATWAEMARDNRQPVDDDNFFHRIERHRSNLITLALDAVTDAKATAREAMFKAIYGDPGFQALVASLKPDYAEVRPLPGLDHGEFVSWYDGVKGRAGEGGIDMALIRALVLLYKVDGTVDAEVLNALKRLHADGAYGEVPPHHRLKELVREQYALVMLDEDLALATLPALVPNRSDRERLLRDLHTVLENTTVQTVLARLATSLGVRTSAALATA